MAIRGPPKKTVNSNSLKIPCVADSDPYSADSDSTNSADSDSIFSPQHKNYESERNLK